MNGELHSQISLFSKKGVHRRVGLTGGIASGKSSVGTFLQAEKKIPVLDADVYSHEALSPGQPSHAAILKRYGNRVVSSTAALENVIDRSALGKIVFSSQSERQWLEKLTHPIILNRFIQELNVIKDSPLVILVIPLLFEANFTELCTEIWVVNCQPEQQLQRLIARDGLTRVEAVRRVKSQWTLEKKANLADVIIDNSKEKGSWRKHIEKLL